MASGVAIRAAGGCKQRPSVSLASRDFGHNCGENFGNVRRDNAVRLQLHALAYNLANFMRTLALPKEVEHWSLTTLRGKLVKIGAKVVRHGHRLSDAWGAAGDQVGATGQSLVRGTDPVCPAS